MVHIRINEQKANPNPYVNFISTLPVGDATAEDQACQVLEALAAQLKPIMKKHRFTVNKLVLRGAGGSFLPAHWLMSTLCHEHMNHGPAFQDLWRRLCQQVCDLQSRGYFGDGYWLAGRRLADSAVVSGKGIQAGDLPEYMCGGAHSRVRPVWGRRSVVVAGPSLHTGAQTTKKCKAGSRVTNSSAFPSTGKALNDDLDDDTKAVGTGFRKQTGSKRAREERALATEKRISSLQVKRDINLDEDHILVETDEDRRRTLPESADRQELNSLKAVNYDFSNDFLLPHDTSENRHVCQTNTIGPSTSMEDRGRPSLSSTHVNKKKRLLNDVSSPSSHKKQRTLTTGDWEFLPIAVGLEDSWSCLACTLINELGHLACSACATPRGNSE
ncbi:WLM-domain-containing protein [Pisolithus microcarpus]|nr:WLM-domain-containing protein [Pisolithus microcarpus]